MKILLTILIFVPSLCFGWGAVSEQSVSGGSTAIFNLEFEGTYSYPTYTISGNDVSDGDTTGTTTNEYHVFVQNTIAHSGYAIKTDSGFGGGLYFDISSADIFNADLGYLKMWVYVDAFSSADNYLFDVSPGSNRFRIYVTDATGAVTFRWYGGDGTNTITQTTTDTLTAATWQLIEARWSVADNKLDIRLNGGTWLTSTASMTTFATAPGTSDLAIGSLNVTGQEGTTYYDDVTIWDTFEGPN